MTEISTVATMDQVRDALSRAQQRRMQALWDSLERIAQSHHRGSLLDGNTREHAEGAT